MLRQLQVLELADTRVQKKKKQDCGMIERQEWPSIHLKLFLDSYRAFLLIYPSYQSIYNISLSINPPDPGASSYTAYNVLTSGACLYMYLSSCQQWIIASGSDLGSGAT